jgi:hypothetical protein
VENTGKEFSKMEDDEDVAKIGKKEKKTHKYLGKIMLRKNL